MYCACMQGQAEDIAPASSSELLYYNSLTSLPLLVIIAVAAGESSALPHAYEVVGFDWVWPGALLKVSNNK